VRDRPAAAPALLLLGVFGATLFYGDSVITPAISVLGAMEGLEVVTPGAASPTWCRPVADPARPVPGAALGTAVVGRFFGPVIVLWFAVLGHRRGAHRAQPAILAALNPLHAWQFLASAAGRCSPRWAPSCWR
jgi:KUP system potassium uptake protein